MKIMKKSLVGIIMGSSSDSRIMHGAAEILDGFDVPHEDQIISAHRTPTRLEEYAKHAEKNGFIDVGDKKTYEKLNLEYRKAR